MSTPEIVTSLIAELNELGEHAKIEAKTASEVGASALETICAFTNEPDLGGGHLLLGVARSKTPDLFNFHPYVIVGVPDPEKVADELASKCGDQTFSRPLRPRITPVHLDGKTVLHVRVDEARPDDKPVYLTKYRLPRGAFRRIGATDQKGTADDLKALYEAQKRAPYDQEPVPGATMDDLDPEAIEQYRVRLARIDPEADVLASSDERLLRALKAAVYVGGTLTPTAAGLLLFGTRLALRREFAMMRIDYLRVPGNEWVTDPEHRYTSVEIRAPLMTALLRLESAVLDDLPRKFHLPEGSLQRQDILPLPQKVLREALVNALIHRDYQAHSPTQVIRYANRIEIHNPGYSLKPTSELGEPGSEPRNPAIASVFVDTQLAETKGTGIDTMRRLMERAELSPPAFHSERAANRFIVVIPLHHFLSPSDLAWLDGLHDGLTRDERLVLIHVRDHGAVDNAAVRQMTTLDSLGASALLRRLCTLDLLVKEGASTATFYRPSGPFLRTLPPDLAEVFRTAHPDLYEMAAGAPDVTEQANQTFVESGMRSMESEGRSMESEPRFMESEDRSMESEEGPSRETLRRRLTPALLDLLDTLKGTSGSAEVRPLVRLVCAHEAWTSADLSKLFGRTQDYFVQRYLRPMVKAGELELTRPDKPNSRLQAYRTHAP